MTHKRPKVTVVGAGATGATTAHWIASKQLADVVLVDIIEGMPQGKALDLQEAAPIEGFDVKITGSNNYEDTANSDVVVITAGSPRKPGMSRDDLLSINANIVADVAEEVAEYSPESCIIVLTNPLDIMSYVALNASGFEPERVMGQSGILDTTRFRTFIALELGVSFKDVQALVLGGHGDSMVPLTRYASVGGIPVEKLLGQDKLEELVERTRGGGGEIVELLKEGSAFYAPSAAVAEMTEAILLDQKRVLPVASYLQGEYGQKGLYMGVPVLLGGSGIERIFELELTEDEQGAFNKSAEAVRETQEKLQLG
jgi:malate dehydrogenase